MKKRVLNFTLKRAFRFGRVKRDDLVEAFPELGPTRLSQLLTESTRNNKFLKRTGYSIVPAVDEWPEIASTEDLIHNLENGRTDFESTGLKENEFSFRRVRWTNNLPSKPQCLNEILKGIVHGFVIDILYVNMRENQNARWRSVAPLGLEMMADQIRLVCIIEDNNEKSGLRTFVLSRILDAKLTDKKCSLESCGFAFPAAERFKVSLNSGLTNDQKMAIESELMIAEEIKWLPVSEEFEFLRRYGEINVTENAVWPLVKRTERCT